MATGDPPHEARVSEVLAGILELLKDTDKSVMQSTASQAGINDTMLRLFETAGELFDELKARIEHLERMHGINRPKRPGLGL